MKKLYLIILVMSILPLTSISQTTHETISVSGGNASGTGGSVSYTIGQIVYTTNESSSGSIAQGVQQPYEISEIVDGIDQQSGNIICSVYPNPTTDFIILKIENASGAIYQLFDASGKLVHSSVISDSATRIDMSGLVSATYFLKILQEDRIVKTYKIIKNK